MDLGIYVRNLAYKSRTTSVDVQVVLSMNRSLMLSEGSCRVSLSEGVRRTVGRLLCGWHFSRGKALPLCASQLEGSWVIFGSPCNCFSL